MFKAIASFFALVWLAREIANYWRDWFEPLSTPDHVGMAVGAAVVAAIVGGAFLSNRPWSLRLKRLPLQMHLAGVAILIFAEISDDPFFYNDGEWRQIPAILAAVALGGLLIWSFNVLTARRLSTDEAAGNIEVLLRRKADLVDRLVTSVSAFVTHERSVLERIAEARSAMASGSRIDQVRAGEVVSAFLRPLLVAFAENYPTLAANEAFAHLRTAFIQVEDQIAGARTIFNARATQFNSLVASFPSSIAADLFGFAAISLFVAEDARRLPESRWSTT